MRKVKEEGGNGGEEMGYTIFWVCAALQLWWCNFLKCFYVSLTLNLGSVNSIFFDKSSNNSNNSNLQSWCRYANWKKTLTKNDFLDGGERGWVKDGIDNWGGVRQDIGVILKKLKSVWILFWWQIRKKHKNVNNFAPLTILGISGYQKTSPIIYKRFSEKHFVKFDVLIEKGEKLWNSIPTNSFEKTALETFINVLYKSYIF